MTVYLTEKEREQARKIIALAIKSRPLDIQELIVLLTNNNIPVPSRTAKEIAWEMYEKKTAVFNKQWLLDADITKNP